MVITNEALFRRPRASIDHAERVMPRTD